MWRSARRLGLGFSVKKKRIFTKIPANVKSVGITAGASAPEALVQQLITRLKQHF
ncbi:MAG: hypothetical protein AAF639_14430, partial [Chloroflexota bacterium]